MRANHKTYSLAQNRNNGWYKKKCVTAKDALRRTGWEGRGDGGRVNRDGKEGAMDKGVMVSGDCWLLISVHGAKERRGNGMRVTWMGRKRGNG